MAKEKEVIAENSRMLRSIATAYKVIGEELLNSSYIKKAKDIIADFLKDFSYNPTFIRTCRLDIAKLYHLEALLFNINDNTVFKIQLIRGLIKDCPNNGEYWVYHGIFQTNTEIKLRSFYKALQLNPKVRHFLTNTFCRTNSH